MLESKQTTARAGIPHERFSHGLLEFCTIPEIPMSEDLTLAVIVPLTGGCGGGSLMTGITAIAPSGLSPNIASDFLEGDAWLGLI
jgi:hypothetical protein